MPPASTFEMIRLDRAENTLIMAMVMTNTGRLNTEASAAFSSDSATLMTMHTASISSRLPVQV